MASSIQTAEAVAGDATISASRTDAAIYGFRSGWNRSKLKFDPQNIPVNLPDCAREEILAEYATYSAFYDIGIGAHDVYDHPAVKALLGAVVTLAVAYVYTRLGLPVPV